MRARSRPAAGQDAVAIGKEIAEALEAAHEKGIVLAIERIPD
jgi:hypothetical protein